MTDHETMAELSLQRFLADPDGREALRIARDGLRLGQWDDERCGQRRWCRPAS